MANFTAIVRGIAGQLLSRIAPTADGLEIPNGIRVSKYNEQVMQPGFDDPRALCDEGSYGVVTNPTIGTGVAHALVTAFSDASGLFAIKNTHATKNLYLDYMRLMLTAAPTAGVSLEFAFKLDSKDKTPTAGNVKVVPVNPNGATQDQQLSVDVEAFSAAALTLPVSSNAAIVASRIKIPVGLNVVGDIYEVLFGKKTRYYGSPPLTAIKAAQPAAYVAHAPQIIVPPNWWVTIHRWSLTEATAAPSYEYEIGMFQR